jgi:hypothetical protein
VGGGFGHGGFERSVPAGRLFHICDALVWRACFPRLHLPVSEGFAAVKNP